MLTKLEGFRTYIAAGALALAAIVTALTGDVTNAAHLASLASSTVGIRFVIQTANLTKGGKP